MNWILERLRDWRTTIGGAAISLLPLVNGTQKILEGDTLGGAIQILTGLSGLLLGVVSYSKKD